MFVSAFSHKLPSQEPDWIISDICTILNFMSVGIVLAKRIAFGSPSNTSCLYK